MRWLAAPAAILAAAALAQSQSPQGRSQRGRADAGPSRSRGPVFLGTDPPGKLRPLGTPDGGEVARIDGGPDELRREVQDLRARVLRLEQERAQLQRESQRVDEVARQIQELRGQIAEGESRKASAQKDEEARRAEVESGVTALQQALSMLSTGDSTVEAQLAQAQAAFPPQARYDVAAARAALENRDLSAARAWLSSAIAHAQQGR